MNNSFAEWVERSGFSAGNAAYLEDLYEQFLNEPDSLPEPWRKRFNALANGTAEPDTSHRPVREHFTRPPLNGHTAAGRAGSETAADRDQTAVLQLINAHRVRAHQCAEVDPLELTDPICVKELDIAYHGLQTTDLNRVFNTGSLAAPDRMTLSEILTLLGEVYRGPIGAEYMHITSTSQKRWIQQRLEGQRAQLSLSADERRHVLHQLSAAEGLERFLHTRYVGQKRFSLEGSEALIPLLDDLIQRAGSQGVKEIVFGMAHRGRLNVLINTLNKSPEVVFDEFEGAANEHRNGDSSGDVKYHQGFSADVGTPGGAVHLTLAFNPSHLEIVNPVVVGSVRARQDRRGPDHRLEVLPVLIHGDAAIAGQGVVMETMNMSQTRGFAVGGTVHIVINNQIGFTTSDPYNARSTAYCTEVAKMIQAPIFHVNGDEPEAVLFVTRMALDFCNRFHRDVLIDLVSYRRHGHNEADEPAITQPIMYRKIRNHPTVRELYAERLLDAGVTGADDATQMTEQIRQALDNEAPIGRPTVENHLVHSADWARYANDDWQTAADTTISAERIGALTQRLLSIPDGFTPHSRVQRIWDDRRAMATGDTACDWGYAETLAYAALLEEGYSVRLTGQDSGRGTFAHRHAIIYDQKDGDAHVPLHRFARPGEKCRITDSLLSEEAVLGFEYGYATAEPDTLVLWEAQFGDFANGAQVVIDQFISSGQAKWGRLCGLVLLLPHGYEGQGPEHSSARPERYMQLCAEHNIQLCQPTTPAQVFHMLRRQMLRPYRRPLIVLTGKSLLRNAHAVSPIGQLTDGAFAPLIDEPRDMAPEQVSHIVFCTGKVYYDLLAERDKQGKNDVAIIRIEQLYPFPHQAFDAVLARFPTERLIWAQEEPQNQGYWDQIKHRFYEAIQSGRRLYYAGRAPAASPATGYPAQHRRQQAELVQAAISGDINPDLNRRKPT